MTGGEKELLLLLQNYGYYTARLREAEERLQSTIYRITPSYRSTGGGCGSEKKSKVEDYAEKTLNLTKKITEYRKKVYTVDAALKTPELSKIERRTLKWIADGWRLSSLAEKENIYQSRIYKIRDRALRKALMHLETHYGLNGRVKS